MTPAATGCNYQWDIASALRRGLMSGTPESVRVDTILSLLVP